jgi:hypothetical protein
VIESKGRRIRLIQAAALLISSLIVILGPLSYLKSEQYSGALFASACCFSPGLMISSVVGSSFGARSIHDPSFILAGVCNFLLYSVALFFLLKVTFKFEIVRQCNWRKQSPHSMRAFVSRNDSVSASRSERDVIVGDAGVAVVRGGL